MEIVSRASVARLKDAVSTARETTVQGITIQVYDEEDLREFARICDRSGCLYSVMLNPQEDLGEDGAPYMITISGALDELRTCVKLLESVAG